MMINCECSEIEKKYVQACTGLRIDGNEKLLNKNFIVFFRSGMGRVKVVSLRPRRMFQLKIELEEKS